MRVNAFQIQYLMVVFIILGLFQLLKHVRIHRIIGMVLGGLSGGSLLG